MFDENETQIIASVLIVIPVIFVGAYLGEEIRKMFGEEYYGKKARKEIKRETEAETKTDEV